MISFYSTAECPVCSGEILEEQILCNGCKEILFQSALHSEGRCDRCFHRINDGVCMYCSTRNIFFNRHVSLFSLNEIWRKFLIRWKFENDRRIGLIFIEKLMLIPKSFTLNSDLICYLDSGKSGYDVRSYQPCRDSVGKWAESLSLPVDAGLKKNQKFKQSGKNQKERYLDLRDAYSLSIQCSEKNVLLVEDVFTTGATANECARILKNAGAVSVNLVCFLMREQDLEISYE